MTTPASNQPTPDEQATLDQLMLDHSSSDHTSLADDVELAADMGYDSMARLQLIGAVEREFGLDEVDEWEVASLRTVGDVRQLVARLTA